MEYRETFVLKGECGMHVRPSIEIAREFLIFKRNLPRNYGLSIEIKKGEKVAYAGEVREVLALSGKHGDKLEVIAESKLDDKITNERIVNLVKYIGKIISDVDRFTFRDH